MKRLGSGTMPDLGYDRSAVRTGVVHLGLGAFHRAHQAPVFDAILRSGDPRWGIAGIAMRSATTVEALAAQDHLYSYAVRDPSPLAPKVVGAIMACAIASADGQRVIDLMAAPDTHIVTLTVTEKGYLLPADAIEHSPPGLIAAGLAARRRAGLGPLTILSCDNRSSNGPFTRQAVLSAAEALGLPDDTHRWIASEIAFPSTMVDRITPAATEAMRAESAAALGLEDRAAIWTEPFWQWVIEDRFADARPDFAAHGVQLVSTVGRWEAAKLRLLNGAHSTLAYNGLLAGHRFVHDAIDDPALRALVAGVWDEAAATLDARTIDIPAYRQSLIARFRNSALPHPLDQIAADGSQKVPLRLIATMLARRPEPSPWIAKAVAGWIAVLAAKLTIADPLLQPLRDLARKADVAGILKAVGTDIAVAPEIGGAWLNRLPG